MPEKLRARVKTTRTAEGETLAAFIKTAVGTQLHDIETTLVETCGIEKPKDCRPARLPMDSETLAALRKSSDRTGVPASTLLLAALSLAAPPAKAAKKAKRATAAKKGTRKKATRRSKS